MSATDARKNELRPCHVKAIASLVASGDLGTAAETSGVSARTLQRWLATPAFQKALAEAETEALRGAARKLGRLADKALRVLEAVMDSRDAADNARLRAAATVLDTALRWREAADLEARVCKLEEALEAKP